MKNLTLSAGTFDYASRFRVAGVRGDVSLCKDYNKAGDGILWGMQHGTVIKSSYSDADRAHLDRMNSEAPVEKGEVVLIDGKQYKARVLGNYSDCVIFDPAE